jgi:hypothetical protein
MTGVLVTGGTGKTGSALVELLRGDRVPVRAASRTPAADDPAAIRFDWGDPATQASMASTGEAIACRSARSMSPRTAPAAWASRRSRPSSAPISCLVACISSLPSAAWNTDDSDLLCRACSTVAPMNAKKASSAARSALSCRASA